MGGSYIVDFMKENYCDIETPSKILLGEDQMEKLLEKGRQAFGEKFSEFLEATFEKRSGTMPNRRKLIFFCLGFDKWDLFLQDWNAYQNTTPLKKI